MDNSGLKGAPLRGGRGESVTRGNRRRGELEARSPSPPLAHLIGHPQAGWRSAVIYPLIPSCRRYGIHPQEYLTDVLGRLPAMTHSQVRQLLPHRWRHARRGGGAGVPSPAPPDAPALPAPVSLTTLTSERVESQKWPLFNNLLIWGITSTFAVSTFDSLSIRSESGCQLA